MNKEAILQKVLHACEERKAENIVVLNMEEMTSIADFFLISSGNNERQVQAIARSIQHELDEAGIPVRRMEGFEQGRWILIDLDYVICHIFHAEERSHYHLERLWGDAPQVNLEDYK